LGSLIFPARYWNSRSFRKDTSLRMNRKENILPANFSGMSKTHWEAAITMSNPFPFSTRWSRWKPATSKLNRTVQQSNKERSQGVEWQSVFWLPGRRCDRSATKLSNNSHQRNKKPNRGNYRGVVLQFQVKQDIAPGLTRSSEAHQQSTAEPIDGRRPNASCDQVD
jgi:hypothetical protein